MDENTTPLADRLAGADLDTLKEIVRNAESFLGAQLTSGLASNQRAMTLTSVLAAATVVLGGSAASLLIGTAPKLPLGGASALTALGLLAAMALAISAAKPTKWYMAGNTPTGWARDVETRKTLERSMAEQAAWYAEMIADNNVSMERADSRILAALRLAWLSLAAGGAAAALAVVAQRLCWI